MTDKIHFIFLSLQGMLSSQGGLTCSPTPPDNSPSPKVTSKVKTITQPGVVKAKLAADVSKVGMVLYAHLIVIPGVSLTRVEDIQ